MPNSSIFKFLNRLLIVILFLFAKQAISYGTNLYSYQTGDWNNIDTWTTDPGGTTLVGSQIPTNGDIVVILSSRTVYLPANIATTGLDITINSGGILNMDAYRFTNILTALRGSGTLQLNTANFPGATTNTFVNTGGGTTEYKNGANFTLPASQGTYNNLVINLTSSSLVMSQLSNITLNGNLQVVSGIYQINNGSAARRQLSIAGDVTVSSGSSWIVGTGNTTTTTDPLGISGGTAPFVNYYDQNTHRVVISGDFTNNGTVRFTNQGYPVYTAFPTNGAATVYFTGGSNNTLTCNNTTDFYNLVVDKGTDQSMTLSINSAGYNYFRLFGANTSGGENGGDNPIIKKALWIRNGTLRLYGLVVIPSLTEGTCDGGLSGGPNSDYFIGSNAALVIDGPDVVVLTTADDYREINAAYGTTATSNAQVGISTGGCSSFSVYGTFQIDDGYVSTRESGGFIYWATAAAQFVVNGGTLDSKQFRTANSSGGLTAYRQTGGTVTLRGRFQRIVTGVTNVASLRTVPLNTARADNGINGNVGTFNIDQDANLFEMSGGTIEILDVCGRDGSNIGRAFEVNSMPSYVNVTGGSIIIRPTTGSVAANYTYYVVSAAPLGNFTIDQVSGTQTVQLTNITKAGVTPRNPALEVLGNLTLSGTNATLVANNYNVETGGNFLLSAGTTYTPGSNNTIFNGTVNQIFTDNGTITSGFYKLRIDKPAGTLSLAGTAANYTVRDSLQINQGTLNDGGKTIHEKGHIYVAGTHAGTGRIVLDGSANQKIDFEISGNPQLGTLELNNATGATVNNNGTVDEFIFTNGMMNIGQYKFTVASGTVTGFDATQYFQTNGIASNGGLRLAVNAASLTTGNNLVFPVGVSGKYTPCTITGGSAPGAGSGFVTFIPVNSIHPAENTSGKHLHYYWRSIATGMPAVSNVYYQFYNNIDGDWESGINDVFTLLTGNTAWNNGGSPSQPTISLNGVPNSQGFISADITAGNPGAFNNVNAFYSIGSGPYVSDDAWSSTSHTGADCNCHPSNASDIVYIGGNAATSRNDSIWATAGFNASIITINGSYTNNWRMPTLNIQSNGNNINVDIIKGDGKFVTTSNIIPNADYGEFINSPAAVFNYHGTGINIGTTITSYPNLLITATSNNQVKTLPNTNIVVNRDLILSTNFTGNILRFNDAGGNLTIYGDIKMRNSSSIQLAGTNPRNFTIYGNIDFRYLNSDNNNTFSINSGTAAHQINFYGASITMGQSTLSLTNCIMNIYDAGNTVITDRTGGTGTITFNRLVINKNTLSDIVTINHPLALSGSTNSYPKALELITGSLELNNSNININLSSGGKEFSIPQTSALIVQGSSSVNVTGNNTGISLDGMLRAEDNAKINLGDGSNTNSRYIEYSGSGNAIISLADNAELKVNSQIRRSLIQTSGVLKYRQYDNSTVTIYGQGANASRAKLEIANSGSEFIMSGGSFTIIRGGGTTFGDLYLRPENGSVTGGTIFLGTANAGAQILRFDSNIPMYNLTLDGVGAANTFQLSVNPLELNGNLLINTSNSILNTNGLNVSVKGNFTDNGTYTSGSNITTLNGATQLVNGTSTTQFYDLVVQPSTSVTLSNHITVNHDLSLLSGTFATSAFNVNIKGNLTNNAVHSGNSASGGLLLNGTSLQLISGSGTFGRLDVNNAAGARMENNINLQQDLLLSNGILNVNQYLLTLGVNSDIVGSGFGVNKMIKPDGVFSNIGIKKFFSAGATAFTFPLGVTGKYTPAVLTINNISAGSIRVNVINERHPTVTDQNNVLQYYWEIESSGLSGFEGNLDLNYAGADVRGTESNYVAARLIIPPGLYWSKAATGPTTDNVDESGNIITFQFPSGTTSVGGEYTAGTDAAIPDEVPIYTSNGDGNWDNVNIWTPAAPAGGPNGFIVIIRPGDHIATNGNRRFAYRTMINGTLDVGTTYGHNLGTVTGTGKLYLESPTLPAGRFNPFFSCSGGTLEFGGNSDYTIVADRIDTLHNLFLTGTGKRVLPDKDIVICDTLKMDGPDVKNDVFNREITLFGTIQRLNASTFSSGSGSNATLVFAGTALQRLGGANGNFTGTNLLNNLEINNSSGLTLQGQLELNGELRLTEGVINTSAANKLLMLDGNAGVVPNGGSSTSYVSGPVSKRIFGGNDFIFPTGKGIRYGKTTVLGVSDGSWESEYFNSGYSSQAVTAPLTAVSSTEYWHITGPAGKQAYVKLRWDPSSDITPLATQNGLSDIRVAEYNTGTSQWVEETTTAAGDNYNGTAQTTGKMNLDQHDYTLASVSALKSKANFVDINNTCVGEDLQIAFSKTAGSYTFTYNINGGSDQPVTTSSNPYTLTTAVAGRYRITGFTGGVVDTNSVLVNPVPTPTLLSNDADNRFCEGTTIVFTATGGSNYQFFVNGASVQNGATSTYSTVLLAINDAVYVRVTNASGCSVSSATLTMTVYPHPVPLLTGAIAVCTDAIEVYSSDAGSSGYTWTVTGGTITAGGTAADATATVTWSTIGDQTVSVNYTNANGCTATSATQLPVHVYRRPETGPAFYVPNNFNQ